MTTFTKISILSFILIIAIGFAKFEQSKIDHYFMSSDSQVLKTLPENQNYKKFDTNEELNLKEIATTSNGLLVHFWGTWCAPCEHELPAFLDFSRKLAPYNIKVILMAVNDEELKIKKFMKRFGELPPNVILINDAKSIAMPAFGVVKVPETFLFNSKLKNLTKFVGPQDWALSSFTNRVIGLLSL